MRRKCRYSALHSPRQPAERTGPRAAGQPAGRALAVLFVGRAGHPHVDARRPAVDARHAGGARTEGLGLRESQGGRPRPRAQTRPEDGEEPSSRLSSGRSRGSCRLRNATITITAASVFGVVACAASMSMRPRRTSIGMRASCRPMCVRRICPRLREIARSSVSSLKPSETATMRPHRRRHRDPPVLRRRLRKPPEVHRTGDPAHVARRRGRVHHIPDARHGERRLRHIGGDDDALVPVRLKYAVLVLRAQAREQRHDLDRVRPAPVRGPRSTRSSSRSTSRTRCTSQCRSSKSPGAPTPSPSAMSRSEGCPR